MNNFVTDKFNNEIVNLNLVSNYHPYNEICDKKTPYHIYFYSGGTCFVAWKYSSEKHRSCRLKKLRKNK